MTFGRKTYFTIEERHQLVQAIRLAENRTSGEIRLFIESNCKAAITIDRAIEIFGKLKMHHTQKRNGVLLYIAMEDKRFAIFGDKGIYEKTGQIFWDTEVARLINAFKAGEFVNGISNCLSDIGDVLEKHFPFDENKGKNELPDDIVFGK